MNALSDEELIEQWRTSDSMDVRDRIVKQMKERGVYPQDYENEIEEQGGLYPDKDDPEFLQKLLTKQEFAENKQLSIVESIRRGIDPCQGSKGFELSPTQRFIGQYLSPKTPYMSALLYHGVGVGKTCSAITVAEGYLEMYPKKQVIIIAPRNIQPNFTREIFSETKLKIGEEEEPNEYVGCTGNTYLQLAGMEYVHDKGTILNRVNQIKARRYQLVGYLAFYNFVKDLLERGISKTLKGERRAQEEMKLLRKTFSNRLIIIDEAHNVRDLSEGDDENQDAPGGKAELSETQAGKKLTPYLRKLLQAAEGTKLLLLTATPMYNSYKEIIPLLNLLLLNDKKATVSEADFFNPDGSFLDGGEKRFGHVVQGYVSFMRGENPLAFPLRLDPEEDLRLKQWPTSDPLGNAIEDETVLSQITNLPFIPTQFTGQGLKDYRAIVGKLILSSGLRLGATDGLVQAGNFMFPALAGATPETRIRETGFKGCFTENKEPKQYKYAAGISPTWLHESEVEAYSPKCATMIKRLRTTKGVSFIYSRFVYSGALSIALALEANGYECAMRPTGYLKDAVLAPGGKQCALCEKKQENHRGSDHAFKQAKYVLLTGRDDLTPNNKGSIELATRVENKDGGDVKIVIGSQVASEGIDLKFIREVLVFDSWFHLNKLEQVIGRGIRYCSHAALPKEMRNCTVLLLITTFPGDQKQETIDMYQYRIGFEKASQIGKITRVMKQYAIDCNLNRDAVLLTGLDPIDVIDGQGITRYGEEINDVPFTNVCDWIETCDYRCKPDVKVDPLEADDSTYDEYAARWRVHQIKLRLRKLFERQPFYRFDDLLHMLVDIPRVAVSSILTQLVGNRSFRIQVGEEKGYLVYKNGFYLFQPEKLRDTGIPLALRTALFPVKQDSYEEFEEPLQRKVVAKAPAAAAADGADAVGADDGPSGEVIPFWENMMPFAESIKDGSLANPVSEKKILPETIERVLQLRYSKNKKAFDKAYNSLSMFVRFFHDIKGKETWRAILAKVAIQYLWDELLTTDEQYMVFQRKGTTPAVQVACQEHLIAFEEEILYRYVNPSKGTVEYMCDGAPCSAALVTALESEDESTDPLRQLRANANTMGTPYGTLNYKDGNFVFKTNVPVAPGANPRLYEKQERGSECANVANMIPHYKLLETIGEISNTYYETDFGLNLDELRPPKKEDETMVDVQTKARFVKNSVRACALTDIALRFLDALRTEEKRWFYRSLPTFYTKHPGILRKKAA